jgi:hypothetical protein
MDYESLLEATRLLCWWTDSPTVDISEVWDEEKLVGIRLKIAHEDDGGTIEVDRLVSSGDNESECLELSRDAPTSKEAFVILGEYLVALLRAKHAEIQSSIDRIEKEIVRCKS